MSKQRARRIRPYIMRGSPEVTEPRATVLNEPDARIVEPPMRRLNPRDIERLLNGHHKLDPRIRAADHCFVRWAVTPTGNAPGGRLSSIVLVQSSRETAPLDDYESKIIDAAVRASPVWASRFVKLWYRSEMSVPDIARELEIKHRQYVYAERDRVLFYFAGRLHEIGFSMANYA